jgi:hypothetical protein
MIDDLDETLRQLLIREIPIKNNEVDITFAQPKREWSARLNRPTLNLFLQEVFENKQLRQVRMEVERTQRNNREAVLRRTHIRMDLNYLVTAWATEPDDEHRLLTRAVMALLRYPTLPEELLPETLRDQPYAIPIVVGQKEHLPNTVDLWSVMDNELKPAISCVVTLALNPYQEITVPVTRAREVRIDPTGSQVGTGAPLAEPDKALQKWSVGGQLMSKQPLGKVMAHLLERAIEVPIDAEGRFAINNLKPGEYTLEVVPEGRKPSRHKLTVPAPDYELEVS